MHLCHCQLEQHGEAIRAIFNHAIAHTTALYEYQPRSEQQIRDWFGAKQQGSWPILGAEDEQGQLLGFASLGPFRGYPANLYSVEHSVYVHPEHRGKGVARFLMQHLITQARERGIHTMVGAIDAGNQASIALHLKLGFKHSGTLPQVGYKFGRWLDLAFYQLMLPGPAEPKEN
ncbi:GNAT family N-acetyltransferase [Shewanella algae]|uniref:GNAT family N-acetyltransferase n=3 Tax=Shewanella algae TaxID=38313 RepID=UPI001187022B|nr:GNAT family N-acetyltransferase [Shewanella algae]MBO2672410.1 N-acetyltransferase [Shewanella algae]MBO2693689.1 N-acetyltransferase [Shewanella algae]MDL2193237.1 N-acetyltransferase family protein [Shewanella algae]MDV2962151.1 N-acetyltransferase family protein [Shewanella algae]TVP03957.1 acetyltransferase [Shewanella algae]